MTPYFAGDGTMTIGKAAEPRLPVARRFRCPRKRTTVVEIYWTVIGAVAKAIQVDVEGLALTVLTHQLAHAYSHLRADTDRKRMYFRTGSGSATTVSWATQAAGRGKAARP